MFVKKTKDLQGVCAVLVGDISPFSLRDTLECGQAFRYELISESEKAYEYMTVAFGKIIRVAQRGDEIFFYGLSEEEVKTICLPYFSLDTDYRVIKEDVLSRSPHEKLISAAEAAEGIRILRQDPWEALFSFIISQNNNIPRIRKIIRSIAAEYGKNLAVNLKSCPLGKGKPSDELCRGCGICYTFPTSEDVLAHPDRLLPSKPGFRYKYLIDAAEKVASGEVDLTRISEQGSAEYTLTELKKIKGVGDKVASCVALFGFGNLEAFPIDVWMKRANEEYFDGSLDPNTLGKYAGVAQQYIFHYIRNLDKNR